MKKFINKLLFGIVFLSLSIAQAQPLLVKQIKELSTVGSTHSVRYVQSNKIVTAGGETHISWMDGDETHLESCINSVNFSCNDIKVKSYHHMDKVWNATVKLGDAYDNHGGPALAIDEVGRLHAVYGPHNGFFDYRKSSQAWRSSAWRTRTEFGSNASYPSMVTDRNGVVHVVYRGKTNPRKLVYQYKPRDSDWSDAVELVTPVSDITGDPYTNYQHSLSISEKGELHLLFSLHYDSKLCHIGKKSRFVGYLKKSLLNEDLWYYSGVWKAANGHYSTKPVDKNTTGGVMLKSVNSEGGLDLKVSGLALDSKGNPWFIMQTQVKHAASCVDPEDWTKGYTYTYGARNFYLYHHDGQSWQSTNLEDLSSLLTLPTIFLPTPSLTIDAHDNIYIAGILKREIDGQSHYSVSVLYKNLNKVNGAYQRLDVTAPELSYKDSTDALVGRDYHYVNIERPTNQGAIGYPWLIYSYTNEGRDSKTQAMVEAAQLGY